MANGLSTRSAAVLLAGVVLAWGTNWPVTKMIVQDVPPGADPNKFFEFDDKPPSRLVRYDKDWYFVAN